MLQQQAVDSPHTPWRLRTQRTRDEAREALLELDAVRRENTVLHNEVQQVRRAAQLAQQEKEEATTELQALAQQNLSQLDSEMRREVERLRSEVEEATREAETRAKSAEEGAENLVLELSQQNSAAELQMLRALAEQQRKWETRERRLEELLAASQRQQQFRERSVEADMLNQGEREELVPVMVFERRISELQEQLLTSQEERRKMATDREPRADRRQLTETGAATDNRVGRE